MTEGFLYPLEEIFVDVILMIIYAAFILGILVFVHEGGHYLASRAFGVRVTEFMLGLPGPSIGFTWKGTRFGVTAIPLGGYAKVCGMEAGKQSPHLERVLAYVYTQGTVVLEEVAADLGITGDEAYESLEELTEWGSIVGPKKRDKHNTYRTPEVKGTHKLGAPREFTDAHALYESEYKVQYRSLPFWKRTIILLAGIIVNLIVAMLLFVVVFTFVGVDVQSTQTGEIMHVTLNPLQAIQAGFNYIGMVIAAVANLFNPATAAQTVSQSSSIMGIAVLSKTAVDQGLSTTLMFVAAISTSLGIMNLIPIPPLDGGRFLIEVIQKLSRRTLSEKVVGYASMAGLILFIGFFLIMVNQDIQRYIFGNW